jgi:serine/threonine protein kinase
MAITHAIGNPENDSERKAIKELSTLPGDDYIVFHNLEIPTPSGLPYEYDIIVVGEYAVYVVEVKGYQGGVKGNAHEWELEGGAIYKSPIPLSNKKAKIVADRLRRHSPFLEKVWVQSMVVLSDDRVSISLNDPQANRVMRLCDAKDYIINPRNLPISSQPITRYTDIICDAIFHHFRPLRRHHEIQDYHVIETIGKNELYTTFLAQHRFIHTNSRYLLKVYSFNVYASAETRQKQEERIVRDADALHRLGNHPNIVHAHPPFSWEHNKIVLPVEWVDGFTLRGLLDTGEELSYSRKVEVIREAFEGLQHAHTNEVIHRDIRPENIVVPHNGPIKLVNFDCARVEGDNLKTIATRIGRHLDERYVAPEVWQNPGSASYVSDIFALGIVFFELLTKQTPYLKIKEYFRTRNLPLLPSEIDPSLPKDVDFVIKQMCEFDPKKRYKSAKDVIVDLQIIG